MNLIENVQSTEAEGSKTGAAKEDSTGSAWPASLESCLRRSVIGDSSNNK